MKTMTLKNIPDQLLERVRLQAERNHRSVNQEVISCLSLASPPARPDAKAIIAEMRGVRKMLKKAYLTPKILRVAREEGRA